MQHDVVVVTGGSKGIGEQVVLGLLKQGVTVVNFDRVPQLT